MRADAASGVRRVALLSIALVLVASGCSDADDAAPHGGARTYFESLDLSSPERAAETFLDAFARDDFLTVWLTLDPSMQGLIASDLDFLQHRGVIGSSSVARDVMAERSRSFPPESTDAWYLFDAMMLAADEHDAFIIDLTGPIRITGVEVDGDRAELSAEAARYDDPLIFHLQKTPKGNWRVFEIVTRGAVEPISWPRPGPAP